MSWLSSCGAVLLVALIACRANGESVQAGNPQWGDVTRGLQSRIWSDNTTISVGESILVHYEIRNASDTPQDVYHNGFWPSNRIDVEDAAGHSVPLTRAGERQRAAFGGPVDKNFPVTLQPGDVDHDFPIIDLKKYFVMDAPGAYHVHYTYRMGPDADLLSNTLIIVLK